MIGLFVAFTVNAVGSWASAIAIWGFAAYRFHANPYDISVLTLCWTIPAVLLAPAVGVWVDRTGPKRAMILGWTACAVAALAMAGTQSLLELQGTALLYGAVRAIPGPGTGALIARLTGPDQLLRLNALLGLSSPIGQVVGPLLASAVLATLGFRAVFVLDAVTYLVGVAVLVPVVLLPLEQTAERGWHRDFREGLRLALHTQLRRPLVFGCAVTLTSGAFLVVEPLYAQRVLGRPASQFALFEAAAGVGSIVAGMLVGSKRIRLPATALAPAVAAYGLTAGLFAGTTSIPLAYLGAGLWGASGYVVFVLTRTLIQQVTPQAAHARVLALAGTAHTAADIFGLAAAGPVLASAGIRIGALALAAVPVVSAVSRRRAPALSSDVAAAQQLP